MQKAAGLLVALLCVALAAGCRREEEAVPPGNGPGSSDGGPPAATGQAPATREAPATAPTRPPAAALRIDAGSDKPWTDRHGNVWAAESGFEGGSSVDRGDIPIENTDVPEIYRTEHHSMERFSAAVPNGRYTVRLHFAETFPGVTEAGMRVFGVKVEDQDLGKVDVFKEAGGARKALVKTAEVTVADGKLDIVFTEETQRPEINAIEVLPRE
jgi:hypothetical protein